METATSKLTKKYQATIPRIIRERLDISGGDRMAFDIEGDMITSPEAGQIDLEFHSALSLTLGEWMSANDEAAYNDL